MLMVRNRSQVFLVEIAIPHDDNIAKAEADKKLKCRDLAFEVGEIWGVASTEIITIVMSVNGLIPKNGITVIVDRYSYSGVAFSAAKGLDINWCKSPDAGLPKPDRVFFLNMPLENIQSRKGFGNERYEVLDFQRKVVDVYIKLQEENWEVLDATRSMDIIHDELLEKTMSIISNVGKEPIKRPWPTFSIN